MARKATLPGTSETDQIVCHVDMDCFYAACERLREPPLRGEPLVVGMGYEAGESHGAVATASYEAREFGVESAMAISEALSLLPRKIEVAQSGDRPVSEAGFYRPVDLDWYESVAKDVKVVLREYAETVREVSIDEAYLDITDRTTWEEVKQFVSELKDEIMQEVGVPASVGVAPTMSAAKVASDHDKPDGLVVVYPGEVADFFEPLDVEAVHGVGPVTASALREMGIETAGDLAAADEHKLMDRFGERGRRVCQFARGADTRSVEPRGKPKSFSRESAFTDATTDVEAVTERIETLATAVATRASQRDVLYQTIGIKVVKPPFDVNTRAQSLPGPVSDSSLVTRVALSLFQEFEGTAVRKVGVRLSNLSFESAEQPTLADWDTPVESSEQHSNSESETQSETDTQTETVRDGQQSLTEYTGQE